MTRKVTQASWVFVGLLGVLLMVAGTMRVVEAQTGGCPDLKGVEGGWGSWSGCNENGHCVVYKYPDTCTEHTGTKCVAQPNTHPSYAWAECVKGVCPGWGSENYGPKTLTHYETKPCP